jgi:hydrogenase expression/formation protein HypD
VAHYRVPMVITGFEPADILHGLLRCVRQLEAGEARLENAYARMTQAAGNPAAQRLLQTVFEPVDQLWRGLGRLPSGGLRLRAEYAAWDAATRFGLPEPADDRGGACQAGSVLRGRLRPDHCPEFAVRCTPQRPLGAPMVSAEGACSAYYRYRQQTA